MKFVLEENNRGLSNEDIIADIRFIARKLGKDTITKEDYDAEGRLCSSTVANRMGSWNNALQLAGLPINKLINIPDEELFENIKALWLALGRRPRYREVKPPNSRFSPRPYGRRFGSWLKALQQFVNWVNADVPTDEVPESAASSTGKSLLSTATTAKRRTRREVSDRQRFRILVRDGFRCLSCGESPLTKSGVELHVDHIIPWSKGGETTDENLQTKCKKCNLGKGNAFNV